MGADPGKPGWASVHEAVAGTEQDFTEGSLGRAIALLAIPMVVPSLAGSLPPGTLEVTADLRRPAGELEHAAAAGVDSNTSEGESQS